MKLKKEFMLRSIAGQDVLVPTGEAAMKYNGLLTVNPTGRFILEQYEKTDDLEEIAKRLTEEFETDIETARKDVLGFTKSMLEHGIIE